MSDFARTPIGIWIESPHGAQWSNQGMTRLLGFIVEGLAHDRQYIFRIVVTDDIRDEAEQDFGALAAEAEVDYTFHSPRDEGVEAPTFDDLASFANDYVDVVAWISLFPNQTALRYLEAPVSTIFPDAIGLAYFDFSDGAWAKGGPPVIWRDRVRKTLKSVTNVITFSAHVARDQVMGIFGIEESRIRIIPHAPPSLDGILPFVQDARRTPESRFRAAEMLRRHATQKGLAYLADFPFEHVRYVAVSTQDRVTKNIGITVEAIERIVRDWGDSFKLIMTAQVNLGGVPTPTAQRIAGKQLQFDVISMPDLSREVHAAFYHCAELVVHPSVFEGGRGVFPYYEAISVGTPCLMADGPHVAELMHEAPALADFVFGPNDADALAKMIMKMSQARDEVTALQLATFKHLRQRNWVEVAREYVAAAMQGIPSRSAGQDGHYTFGEGTSGND